MQLVTPTVAYLKKYLCPLKEHFFTVFYYLSKQEKLLYFRVDFALKPSPLHVY